MKKIRIIFTAFLLAGLLAWSQAALAVGTQTTTVSSLMKVLKEEKQKAVYNINLNAPFNKDTSGVRESVSTETGEVMVDNSVFEIPGRNGMDLSMSLEYRSRDAKTYNEGTKSGNTSNNYGQTVIAWYDVFDSAGYWLKTGGLSYPAGYTIDGEATIDGNRWVFTGNMQYENGTSIFNSGPIINTTIEKSRTSAAKYIFGEGWSLSMPSLDIEGESVYVNLPGGQTYMADFTSGTGLKNYELTDIVFTKDTTYSNGKDTSAYKLYYASGDSYYFSTKGELLAETDRFRNTIRYYYEDVNGLRLLTKVVDSVGRAVDIQYNNTVTIFKSGGRSVRLVKTPVPGVTGKYYLSSFIDTQGREFHYKYSFQEAGFDQVSKTAVNNLYANLIEISYPTGAKTKYVWDKGKKNLGTAGYMDYFKAKERSDVDGDRTYNRLTYQYHNEPDGYPTYKAASIDELYKYYSTVTDSKGLTTKYMYNSKHLPYLTQQYSGRLLSENLTQYHAKYKLPIRETTKTYNAAGNAFEKVDTYDYDHRGNVIAENHPAKPDEVNSDERIAFYTYDYEYNLMTSKKFKQDKDTTVEIKYDLSPDKKTVAAQSTYGNGKITTHTEYTYDSYGNVLTEKIEKQPGEWVTTRLEYSTDYKGAYPTGVISEDVKDADGGMRDIKTSSTYDFATGNTLTATDGNGNTTSYEYDSLDRVTKETNPDNSTRSYKYDDLNNILEAVNANGSRLIYNYDGLGNLINVTEPQKNTILVEMEYDENENPVSEKDANQNLKKLAYDAQTRITGVTNYDTAGKLMADTRVSYDEAFKDRFNTYFKVAVTKKGDQEDRVSNYYFDTYERLAKLGRINGTKEELARTGYDYLGNQVETTSFAGQKSIFQYDALSRLVKSTDAQGSSTKSQYDRLGNMIAQTDALGRTVYSEYDKLGRQTMVKAPFESGKFSISKYYYDNNGNLVKTVDPEGYTAKQYFTNRNFLSAVERVINSKESNITKYEYDLEGNTTKVIKGLNSWTDPDFSAYTYKYNNLNQLIMMQDASNRKTTYEYDDNGNLVNLTDRNNISTLYKYDGLNRLVEKRNTKDGKKNAVKLTFDKLGQTRQMTDASGTTIFNYDTLGRLTTINYGNGIRQNYAYDRADRVSNMQVLQGSLKQMNLNYEYDKTNRLTAVRDNGKKFGYKYNAIGQLVEESNGVTGIKSSYQYYPSGNIKNLRHFDGKNVVSNYEYRYDMRGNQVQKDEGTGTTKYYYDALSRIRTAITPDKTQNYEYDDLDNIKQLAEIKGTKVEETNYLYDKDSRLLLQETNAGTETTQRRFTYDSVGNQLTKDEVVKRNSSTVASKNWNYWYDGFNQLSRVQNPDGQFTDYTYNGSGLRTKKDFGDKATNYYYNGANIILETDKDNAVTAKNVRGLRLIYRESYANGTDPQYLYYLHNAHGDVTQLLNEKGQVIKDYRYDAFGKEEMPESKVFGGKQTTELWRQEVEKIDNPFSYCGEYLDSETGNYYLRARYYDASIQRFTQEDSYAIAYGAAWKEHLYSYAGNNPVRFSDPTGHILMQKGSSGIQVKVLQTQLISMGYKIPHGATGYFGNETQAAANKYKADHKLDNSGSNYGKVGNTTFVNIVHSYANTSPSVIKKNLLNPKINGALNHGTKVEVRIAADKPKVTGNNQKAKDTKPLVNTTNLGIGGMIVDSVKGYAKGTNLPGLGQTANFVSKRVTVMQVVADISEQVANNPNQSIETSITKAVTRITLKTAGHAGINYAQADIQGMFTAVHVEAAIMSPPPVKAVLGTSYGGITYANYEMGNYAQKGWDYLVDEITK